MSTTLVKRTEIRQAINLVRLYGRKKDVVAKLGTAWRQYDELKKALQRK